VVNLIETKNLDAKEAKMTKTFKITEYGTYWQEFWVEALNHDEAKKKYLAGEATVGDLHQNDTSYDIEEE